jgi:kojibiose phosphorylase
VEARDEGFDELIVAHIDEWERRWEAAAVVIDADPEIQKWINFAGYHLIIAANHRDEYVSISARTLTGTIYKGHVFWDTEMFMLPFFIYTHPDTARALLMYRYHTLDGARKEAADLGLKGALYAWESTTTGEEMTPEFVTTPNGEVILILSGKMEQHINFAVSYGVWHYWTATRDEAFFVNAGAEILIETARFWTGRAQERNGSYHIFSVEGPDEYHEIVNDSIYTNMTVVWNIRQAFYAVDYLQKKYPEDWERVKDKIGLDVAEFDLWQDVHDNMYLNGISSGGLIEQFEGYFSLKDIDVYDYEPRTVPLDAIIGREETAASQLVKQADVVLLLYLLEQEFSEKTIRDNYQYYERRTGHGSSLSPSTYGLVAARLGLEDLAERYLKQAGQIDLANNMGNASGGVHGAALGGLWQQMIMGFIGARITEAGLFINPKLLEKWNRVTFSLIWRGNRLVFDIERNSRINVVVRGLSEVQMGIYGLSLQTILPGRAYSAVWNGVSWREFEEVQQKDAEDVA